MVSKSPKDRVLGPLPDGRTSWLISGGDPNHLVTGMILQVAPNRPQVKVRDFRSRQLDCIAPFPFALARYICAFAKRGGLLSPKFGG